MELLIKFFNTILYQPLLNVLVLLYQYLPGQDFGMAVIVLTILIKILFYPLGAQAIRSQKILSDLQSKIQEIQKKYKDDKGKQVLAIMELYQKEKINPFSGCLPILIQLPIIIALYQVFWKGLDPTTMNHLYSFVPRPKQIDLTFFGMVNLAQSSIVLAILAGVSQFFQTKMVTPKDLKIKSKDNQTSQFTKIAQKQMLYLFPIFTIFILWKLPSALALYWLTTTSFTIIQQYFILKRKTS